MDDISMIAKQFLSVTPLTEFKWNINEDNVEIQLKFDEKWQELVINSTIKNPLLKRYPISQQYTRRFIKTLIALLENSHVYSISDELYELCASSMSNGAADDQFFYRIYYTSEDEYIAIKESNSFVVNGSTGLVTWQAGKALAEWAICNKHLLRSKVLLELGCGLGLTGIVISKTCQPTKYIFTDTHPRVINQLEHNISVNFNFETTSHDTTLCKMASSIVVSECDWLDEAAFNQLKAAYLPDVVLAADVVYDVTIIPSLVKVLNCFLTPSAVAYVACTVRCEETLACFIDHIGEILCSNIENH
ncbi:Protein fam86a [Chamberlinius hualienensis]